MDNNGHRFDLVYQTRDAAEWQCPECERRVMIDENGLHVLVPGDQEINHGSAGIMQSVAVDDSEGH